MKLLISFVSIFLLSSCAHHGGYHVKSNPAQTRVETPYGSVKYHCPPGQAKKGRCVR